MKTRKIIFQSRNRIITYTFFADISIERCVGCCGLSPRAPTSTRRPPQRFGQLYRRAGGELQTFGDQREIETNAGDHV